MALPFFLIPSSTGRTEYLCFHRAALRVDMLTRLPDQAAIAVQPKAVREGPFRLAAVAAFVHAHRGNRLSQDLDALPAHQLRAARQLDAIPSSSGKSSSRVLAKGLRKAADKGGVVAPLGVVRPARS